MRCDVRIAGVWDMGDRVVSIRGVDGRSQTRLSPLSEGEKKDILCTHKYISLHGNRCDKNNIVQVQRDRLLCYVRSPNS